MLAAAIPAGNPVYMAPIPTRRREYCIGWPKNHNHLSLTPEMCRTMVDSPQRGTVTTRVELERNIQ